MVAPLIRRRETAATFNGGETSMTDRLNDHLHRLSVGTVRIIVGRDGREWVVREVPAPDFDRRQRATLVFEAPDVMRRVRQYPENWRALPDDELFDVSLVW